MRKLFVALALCGIAALSGAWDQHQFDPTPAQIVDGMVCARAIDFYTISTRGTTATLTPLNSSETFVVPARSIVLRTDPRVAKAIPAGASPGHWYFCKNAYKDGIITYLDGNIKWLIRPQNFSSDVVANN